MSLIKHGNRVADDLWHFLADDESVGDHQHIVVSLERWRKESDSLVKAGIVLGVHLDSGHQATDLSDDVRHLELVSVEFPSIADGRGYTIGRVLRQRFHFSGELRAVGPIVRDQFPLLHRCGFDAVDARDEAEAAAWDIAVDAISVAYQPDVLSDHNSDPDDQTEALVAAA
jgi:uncharacterized protein (DUF934 family)